METTVCLTVFRLPGPRTILGLKATARDRSYIYTHSFYARLPVRTAPVPELAQERRVNLTPASRGAVWIKDKCARMSDYFRDEIFFGMKHNSKCIIQEEYTVTMRVSHENARKRRGCVGGVRDIAHR